MTPQVLLRKGKILWPELPQKNVLNLEEESIYILFVNFM